jgi:hypothetical protein
MIAVLLTPLDGFKSKTDVVPIDDESLKTRLEVRRIDLKCTGKSWHREIASIPGVVIE